MRVGRIMRTHGLMSGLIRRIPEFSTSNTKLISLSRCQRRQLDRNISFFSVYCMSECLVDRMQ